MTRHTPPALPTPGARDQRRSGRVPPPTRTDGARDGSPSGRRRVVAARDTSASPRSAVDVLRDELAVHGTALLDAAAALGTPEAARGPAVVLLDDWTLGLAAELSRHALAQRAALLPVRCDGRLLVVGPVLRSGAAACLSCTEYQRLATAGGRVPWLSPRMRLAGRLSPRFAGALAALARQLLTSDRAVPSGDLRGATVHLLHQGRGTWSTHRGRPFGGCAICHPLPPDGPDPHADTGIGTGTDTGIGIGTEPVPLPDPFLLRSPNPRTGLPALRAALHDERFGPVRRLTRSEGSVFALTTALVTDGRLLDDGGYGRGADFAASGRVALFEAVERFAGMRPAGRRTVLRSSFAALGPDRALDPRRLGLPDFADHGQPPPATVPYHPDLELDWVHGWSLTRRRPLAVPEHVAYWDVPGDGPRVVYESSNGCGLGNSPQEAALYGLFEVAERDAFLMAWYAATPLRRVAVPADDPVTAQLADRAALVGYELLLLDATNDLGIPAVVAVCRYRGSRPDAPRAFLAAGAHHDPLAAIRSAVAEVVTNVHEAPHRALAAGGPRDPRRLRPMLERPDLVRSLDDHVGLNTLPEAQPRLEFLFAPSPAVPWQEAWPGAPAPVTDLTALLTSTVRRLAGLGLEVVAVRQDEHGVRAGLGLHCAKVIVPGTLPMTFGHLNRRTHGLPRLLEVPALLGRTDRIPHHDELALHPHPFP
ncbi:TOMM precursor leader peptide-binding protein [Streptomyces bambusae]|uniref:TOMM leader peptide-binding protein n=1 Tax=Streptomyces bambusae TaxID=1550616 RepID=A0ABS6Z932_9ACTN|nr:TOMM precursor leader peptide-binding protein [Streptomyces bambusae]MBW5484275.1 TOMM precursor leader peptide-binding protein [Streptomyces bambusae]